MNTWVLVANSSEARIYDTASIGEDMECIKEFSHPEGREKGSELASDRPGHYQSKGTGHGAFVEPTAPKEHEVDRFAGELARELDKGRTSNAYRKLVVVASPHFHGLINSHLDEHTRSMVVKDIQKDLTDCEPRDLPSRLKEYM